ncbi:MAG: glycosyl transferase [Clostridia bacterium]|nr:glycosyl transferase [Clostridia bacterium]
MKILILTCNTGGGHNTAASAVLEVCQARGHETVKLDFLSLINQTASDLISNSYINIAKYTPHFFGMIYGTAQKLSTTKRYSPVYYAMIPFARKLQQYLENNRFDAVVMTHLFACQAVSYLRRKGYALPLTVAIATDYTCQPFWEELDCDYYVIPHADLVAEYVRRGLPEQRLAPLGIPVSKRFSGGEDRAAARKAMDLPPDDPVFLVMGGSMGSGRIMTFAQRLYQEVSDGYIVVICGNNQRLLNALNEKFRGKERVRIIGFTDQVAAYMSACDVLYTKPGGLTSTEALVRNVPLIHTAPIPGCETANSMFFEEHGLSYAAQSIDDQITYGVELARDAVRQRAMMKNQSLNALPDAAERILDLIEEKSR